MSSIWSTSSNPPGSSTTAPTPATPSRQPDDDDDFQYDFAFGSPADPDKSGESGESFQYVPSPEISRTNGARQSWGSSEGQGGVMGLGLTFSDSALPMQSSTSQVDLGSPPLVAPQPQKPVYSRWAAEGYTPEAPTLPMKLLKSPASTVSARLDADAPSFAPLPVFSAPSPTRKPVPIRAPETRAEQSIADKFRARMPPGVLRSMPSYHAPTPPPPPSPATSRSVTPGTFARGDQGWDGSSDTSELKRLQSLLEEAKAKAEALEREKQSLMDDLREASDSAMKDGERADSTVRTLEEQLSAMKVKCLELEREARNKSRTSAELQADLQRCLDEAVVEIVRLEDTRPSTDAVEAALRDSRSELDKLRQQQKSTMDLVQSLQDQLDHERVRLRVVDDRKAELISQVDSLTKQLIQSKQERDTLRAQYTDLQSQHSHLQARFNAVSAAKDPRPNGGKHYCITDLVSLRSAATSSAPPDLSKAPTHMLRRSPSSSNGASTSSAGRSPVSAGPHPLPRRPSNGNGNSSIKLLQAELELAKAESARLRKEKQAVEFQRRTERERSMKEIHELQQAAVNTNGGFEEEYTGLQAMCAEMLEVIKKLEQENTGLKQTTGARGAHARARTISPPSDDDGFVTPEGASTRATTSPDCARHIEPLTSSAFTEPCSIPAPTYKGQLNQPITAEPIHSAQQSKESGYKDGIALSELEHTFTAHGGYEPVNEPAAPFASWSASSDVARAEGQYEPRYTPSVTSSATPAHSVHSPSSSSTGGQRLMAVEQQTEEEEL